MGPSGDLMRSDMYKVYDAERPVTVDGEDNCLFEGTLAEASKFIREHPELFASWPVLKEVGDETCLGD